LLNEFVRMYEQVTRLNANKQELVPLGNLEPAVTKIIKSMNVLTDILSG